MKKALIKLAFIVSILGMIVPMAALATDDVTKLAILPFKVNADRDFTFLQNGIADMLSSRLNRPGELEILDRRAVSAAIETITTDIDEAVAREIGTRLGVDHVLFGSITAIGEAVSVDTRIVDVGGTTPTKPFYIQADTMGAVIPEIDRLTAKINQQVFGVKMRAEPTQPTPSAPVAPSRKHPEKMLTQKKGSDKSALQPTPPPAVSGKKGAFIEPIRPQTGDFWRSRTLNLTMNGMALGDLDGDGLNEMVIISNHQIHTFRYEGGQLVRVGETKKERNRFYVGVDIADINANGRPEIFITALDIHKSKVRSQVLESDGVTFETLVKESPWYYRVSTSRGKAPLLLGQKPVDEEPYTSAVYALEWNGTDYETKRRIVPKKKTNALGCVVGDLLNDGSMTVAAFSDSDAIQIFDENGGLLGENDGGFGGNLLSVSLPVDSRGEPPPLRYLPLRLVIGDLSGNGQNELVVVKNKEFTGKHLARLRMFNKSQIVGLNWDGVGMAKIWQTRELSGRVADLAVADLEGDGRQDLILVLVAKEGRLIGMKPKANIIAYPLQ